MERAIRTLLAAGLISLIMAIPAAAQFGQNKITYGSFDWQVYHSPHFDIHYYPEMEPFLEQIVSYSESAYLKISRDLDHELRFRVPLVIYKTHGEFQQTNITLSELPDGVGAFAEPIQNRMVLPIDQPPDKLYALISHELVHIFQYSIFYDGYLGRALRSNIPTWLTEGMASYFADDEDNLDRMAIRDAVINNILPPIQALNVLSFLTYRYGHAIFDYMEQEHGPEGVRSFLFEYRKVLLTNNIEKAIKESFGYDVDAFNRRFNRYLRHKYFPVLMEKKSPDEYGTEIGLKRPGAYTFSPNISPSGELVAALSTPKMELDLVILSADDGSTIKNLTKGWSNSYRNLESNAFEGKRDLSWSPTADEVAVFARRENGWPLLVFNALNGKKIRDITFDDIVQCSSPAFSPDGRKVAFEGNRNGVVDIFEVDLETKAVRNVTQDDFFDANPWYTADGSKLLYNRRLGAHWKIFSVDAKDPERKEQLTIGTSSDIQPSLSRDGDTLFFSSDRGEYGVFNIYSMDLETGEISRYTDVSGGTFAPVEMAEREGDDNLVFTAYFNGTFRLFRMPLIRPEATVDPFDEPLEAEPFRPPLSLTVDEPQKDRYKLKWDIEAPFVSVGVADDGTFLGNAAIQFSDLMGNHRVQVIASTVSDFSNYNVVYLNLKRRVNFGASFFDQRDYFLRQSSSGFIDRDQINRVTGVNAFMQYPISRHYRFDASVGIQENSDDLLVGSTPTTLQFQKFTDLFLTTGVALTGDTTRYQSFGPFQGKRFRIGASFAPHLSGDSDGDFLQYSLDFRKYRQATRRSVFAVRLASIYNAGDRQTNYGFGGINQLRGWEFREFVGSRIAWANFEFRFPLIDELRFPILRLGQIRGMFFVDVGAAWFEDDLWYDPEFGTIRADFVTNPANPTPVGFKFWDSDIDRLQDGRASYGTGFQFFFLGGLQFNWVWARRLDYQQYDPFLNQFVKQDGGGSRMDFYITFDF